ncbi:PQQ-dependent dehydrogenase, methanol/ethanol family [Oceanicoccus sagamiensis]|uniref:Cytochrome c domain-containing protein n=1 Tax=Oceanicoccus sagamiensis TaxID=716816 RepID=A0A1X9NIP9_9GAMM|nr:PQQ-dependent dehydrogenase, methanol/ethanol family [Oceanicoccus sagamiensis]ARN74767.1 hypothetical protein BST96_11945 [Oceanicoccus sagamiensis]
MQPRLLLLVGVITLSGCFFSPDQYPQGQVTEQRLNNAAHDGDNWLSHGRTYSEQRFSPLTQINDSNISTLGLAWFAELNTQRGIEATPIVVDGVMYVTASWNIIVAIDAKTGRELWRYDPKVNRNWAAKHACCDVINRGVAAWGGAIYSATLDGRLLALNAATGELLWEALTIDQRYPYTITGAPRVVKGKVMIGNSGADFGVRGYISAYDANNGKQLWRFYTVPESKDGPHETDAVAMAAETWSKDSWWSLKGGGTVWNAMAYDPELDLFYFGVGNGTPWSVKQRSPGGGDNLFLSSIIAVRPDTGEYVWHYQTTPGESWNYSAVEDIILAELTIDGQLRQVLMQAPKNGFFYVLDRRSGELISAEPFVDVNWATHIDKKTGRPVIYPGAFYGNEGRLIVPGPSGGHNWRPMSFNPATGLVYFAAMQIPNYYRINENFKPEPGFDNSGFIDKGFNVKAKAPDGGKASLNFSLFLLAWDPVAQKEVWRIDQTKLGGGTLTTAGNLVFQGLGSGVFSAYDAKTGKSLWSFNIGTSIMPGPVSYTVDGEQYITVLVGRGGGGGLVGGPTAAKWAEVKNMNRVVTFKLGAHQTMPMPEPTDRVLDPIPLPTKDKAVIQQGKALYGTYCFMCHGLSAVSGGVLPDLRYTDKVRHGLWQDIVIGGLLESNGMRSHGDVLTAQQATAIQTYVLSQAHRLKKRQDRKASR